MELVGFQLTDREILHKLFTLFDMTGDDLINYRVGVRCLGVTPARQLFLS